MGKKGSWFSAIKRIFVHNPKEKQLNEHENNNPKENKKKIGGQRHGETKVTKSFIPKFREPSSIEKILGEADEQKLFSRPSTPFETPLLTPRAISSPKAASPKATQVTCDAIRVASPRASSQRVPSPKASSSSRDVQSYNYKEVARYKPEPTLRYRHLSATKIQAAYKGYKARRSCRALRGIVRLQEVMRGQNVKRQTENTMKMMQRLVRFQTQLRSQRRRDMLLEENQRPTFHQSEAGNQEDWDDSTLTKEEIQARILRRTEAALKRERTLAYAFFRQSGKSVPKSTQASVPDIRPGGSPWWSWLERQHIPITEPNKRTTYNYLTPSRNITPEPKPSPRSPSTYNHIFDNNYEAATPTSTRSMAPLRSKHFMPTPTHGRNQVMAQTSSGSAAGATTHKTPPRQSPSMMKIPKTRTRVPISLSGGSEMGLKDDDSLMSCPPPYSVPNYMTPTASASAKARPNSNPKERFPGNDSKRRFSFPMTPNIGSFKWNKETSKNDDDWGSKKQYFNESERDFSVDSAISMPSAAGRKAFNRFV